MTGHLFTTGDGSLSFWHNSSCPSFSSFVFSLYLYFFLFRSFLSAVVVVIVR